MSVDWGTLGPMIDIALEDATHRRLPLEIDDNGMPVLISQSPDEGFPPPITMGAPEQNSDVRTRKTVWKDWRRGMGRDEYDETNGIAEFRDSQCDTRFPNVLVCRPLPVRLGSATTVNVSSDFAKVVPCSGGSASWFSYTSGGTAKYYVGGGTDAWTATALTLGSDFYTRGPGGMFYIWDSRTKISQSDDGVTWNTVQITDIDAASATVALNVWGLVVHDNKLFTMSKLVTDGNSYALFQSADATITPTTATWTQLGTLVLDKDEFVGELRTWRFPPDPGRPGIFCLTNRRIYYYDDTADAASVTAWKRWHEWDTPYATNGQGHMVVHGGTGDLYAMPNFTQDRIWQFTGSTITPHAPGEKGGLPPSRQHSIAWTQTNGRGLYCWLQANPPYTGVSGNTGMVVHMNDQDGWHHIFDTGGSSIAGIVGKFVSGGGVNDQNILTVLHDGTVWSQELYDVAYLPQYDATARSYDTTPLYHITAKTDIGTPTLKKVGLYVEINAKIPTGATVAVAYRMDDSDGTGSFTTMDTFTDAASMPARIGFGSNIKFRQMELKFTLTRGTATSATPILYSAILHTTLVVPIRWVYQVRVDLRRGNVRNIPGQQVGRGITSLSTWVRALHGQVASFTIAHPSDDMTCSRAQVTVTPIEDPTGLGGRYLLQFRSLETPLSGA